MPRVRGGDLLRRGNYSAIIARIFAVGALASARKSV
jgi:hypothetical protein